MGGLLRAFQGNRRPGDAAYAGRGSDSAARLGGSLDVLSGEKGSFSRAGLRRASVRSVPAQVPERSRRALRDGRGQLQFLLGNRAHAGGGRIAAVLPNGRSEERRV